MLMVEEKLSLWEKGRLQDCARYWYPEKKKTAIQDLLDAFSSLERVSAVLGELNPHSARLFATLLESSDVLTRGQLSPGRGAEKDKVRVSIRELEDRALLFLMKNRMKLDDGLDRLIVNPQIRDVLSGKNGFLGISLFATDSITLNTALCEDALSEGQLFGGVIPVTDETPASASGIIFLDNGFTAGYSPRRTGDSEECGETVTLDGILIVSQLLSLLRKRKVHLSGEEEIRSRDLASLSGDTTRDPDRVREFLFWARECGLLVFSGGECRLTPGGAAFLRMPVEERRQVLLDSLSGSPQNGEETIGQLFGKWLKKRKITTGEDSRGDLDFFRRFVLEYRRRWLAGELEAVCNLGRIGAVRSIKKDSLFHPLPGCILITGGLEIHVLEQKIAPVQSLFLKAFGIAGGENSVRFSEESIRKGLLLGFSGKRFLELFKAGCDREPPQSFIFTLQDWVNSFQTVSSGEALLLRANDTVRELFLHDRELSPFYIASLDNGMIAVRGGDRQQLFTLLEKRHILLHFINDEDD